MTMGFVSLGLEITNKIYGDGTGFWVFINPSPLPPPLFRTLFKNYKGMLQPINRAGNWPLVSEVPLVLPSEVQKNTLIP